MNTTGATTVTTRCNAPGLTRTVVLDRSSEKGATYTFECTLASAPADPGSPVATIALPTSTGTAEIEANFIEPGHATDRYQLSYPYSVEAQQVSVLTPGWGRFLFQYDKAVWVNQDVSPTLGERR